MLDRGRIFCGQGKYSTLTSNILSVGLFQECIDAEALLQVQYWNAVPLFGATNVSTLDLEDPTSAIARLSY